MRAPPILLLVVLAIALPAAAAAPPSPDLILQRTFDNYRAKTSQTNVAMTIHRPAWERRLSMTAWTRGDSDALVRFTQPAQEAGNATLKLGLGTWVFNPKLNQVIKLPSSMMTQSWMGSDFSYNDLAKSEDIITFYTHKLINSAQTGGHTVWTIEADPKPGAPVVWGKIVLEVRDDLVLTRETFFDQDMKPAKQMVADRVSVLAGRSYPVTMTMHPLDQPGQWTRIDTADAKFDVGVPDYLFTLSNLQNPRP